MRRYRRPPQVGGHFYFHAQGAQPFSSIRINLGFRVYSPLDRERYILRALITNNNQEVELKRTVLSFLSDESGATAIEYGLIAAGISLAIIAIVNGLGTNLSTKFTDINTSLK
jgi:pilus assembly protein Flp/PilA